MSETGVAPARTLDVARELIGRIVALLRLWRRAGEVSARAGGCVSPPIIYCRFTVVFLRRCETGEGIFIVSFYPGDVFSA